MDHQNEEDQLDRMLNLGAWLGRRQAFNLIANRCTAADAECLKAIRDGGEYKELELSWEQFCEKHAGISRWQANRQIQYLEEFGANYFRLSEVMAISPETYRLLAAAINGEGLDCSGERIALTPENRGKIASAIKEARANAAGDTIIGALRKKLDALLADVRRAGRLARRRQEVIGLIDEGCESLEQLRQELRAQR